MSVPVTPGQYLMRCRRDAGMTIDDIALRIDSVPAVAASRRAELVKDIELGLIPVRLSTALALAEIPELRIDLPTLAELSDDFEQKRFGGMAVRLTPIFIRSRH